MKKNKSIVIGAIVGLIVVTSMLLVSCGEQNSAVEESRIIDSDVSYNFVVPTQSGKDSLNLFFSVPFYRICPSDCALGGDEAWDNIQEFTVGDEVEVSGENVEAIDGMTISITQSPLKEIVGSKDEYVDDLVASYERRYEESVDKDKVSELIQRYYDDCYLISANASFDGTIPNDVVITSIDIPDIDFSYSFDNFSLKTKEIDNDELIKDDNGDAIEYSAYSGSFMDNYISRLGYYHLEGKALVDIKSLKLISLEERCKIIDSSIYKKYSADKLLDGVSEPDYKESLSKDEDVDQDYYYIFDAIESDATIANLALETIDSDGTKRWMLVFQPSSIEGQYLPTKVIHESFNK